MARPTPTQRPITAFCLALLIATAPSARAETPAETAARLATEGRAIGSPRGAGGDPQTSVAQSVTSSRPSANLDTSIADQLGPYGDPFGFRAFLKQRGVTYSLTYIGESLGNVTGGARQRGIYEGLLDLEIDVDLEPLLGWTGARSTPTCSRSTGPDFRAARSATSSR